MAICTRNRSVFLEKAIRSVLPQLTPDTELLVIDNQSTDDTRHLCDRLAMVNGAVGYLLETKLGLSVARNAAIRNGRGKFVLFLDDDALAEPGWLAAYRNFFLSPPAARIMAVGGGVIPFYDCQPPQWVDAKQCHFDWGDQPLHLAGGGLSGCNSAYARETVMALGGFDEKLGYQGSFLIPREESELQDRLIKAGGECWWLPGAAVQHFVAAQRLTVKSMAMAAFLNGRAAAIHRLKNAQSTGQRVRLRLKRWLISPFVLAFNLALASVLFVVGQQKKAVRTLCRATRAAGWIWQLIVHS